MSKGSSLKWWSSPRALLRGILMLEDTPHSIALGTAIGMCIGLTPTVGIQMILVMCTAWATRNMFHFNRVAALITVYISNPITVVPIYYSLYWIGHLMVGGDVQHEQFTRLLEYDGFQGWWDAITGLFVDIGSPLILGTCIVAPLGGLMTYPLMRRTLNAFHRLKPASEQSPSTEETSDKS